jgi:tryptophanyl-tRNA synthetase
MRHYAEIGDSEKVAQILEEKGDKIALAKMYEKTSKDMGALRNSIRQITNDKSMDGETKREQIDRMKELISMLAEQAEEVRKSMKN